MFKDELLLSVKPTSPVVLEMYNTLDDQVTFDSGVAVHISSELAVTALLSVEVR